MKRSVRLFLSFTVLSLWALISVPGSGYAAYPEKPVAFVVHMNPGDGADIYARAIADAVNTDKLMPKNMVVMNKPGGSGANMYNFMMQNKGDPYFVMTAQANLLTSPLRNNLPYSYKDFTPVARMAIDPMVVAVRTDSKFKTMKDLLGAAKAAPGTIIQSGSVAGGTEFFVSYLVEETSGVEFKLLPHRGGSGEAVVTLLAGNGDFVILNPGEVLGQVQAGKLRLLASTTDQRIPMLPDVPTLKEQGISVSWSLFRGVAMSKGVPQDAVDSMQKVMQSVTKTQAWGKYLSFNNIVGAFMPASEFKAFLDREAPHYARLMKLVDERAKKK